MGTKSFNFAVQQELSRTRGGDRRSDTTGIASDLQSAFGAVAAAPVLVPYAIGDTTLQSLETVKNFVVDPGGRGIGSLRSDVFNDDASVRLLGNAANTADLPLVDYIADRYESGQEGYQLVGDVATLFTGVGAIHKGTKGIGALAKPISGTKTGRMIFGDHNRVEKLYNDYANLLGEQARKGEIITTQTNPALIAKRKEIHETAFNIIPRKGKGLGEKIKEAVATEAAIVITMNESDAFFPEGNNNWDYAAMGVVGIGVPTIIERLHNAARIRTLNADAGRKAVFEGRESLAFTSDAVTSDEMLFMAGVRSQSLRNINDATDPTISGNVSLLSASNERLIAGELDKLSSVKDGLASNLRMSEKQQGTVKNLIRNEPSAIMGTRSIHNFADQSSFEALRVERGLAVEALDKTIKNKKARPVEKEAAKLRKAELDNTEFQGYSPEGISFTSKARDGFDSPSIASGAKYDAEGAITLKKRKASKKADPWEKTQAEITSVYRDMPKAVRGHVETLGKLSNQNADEVIGKAMKAARARGRTAMQQDYSVSLLKAYREAVGTKRFEDVLRGEFAGKINSADELIERMEMHAFRRSATEFIKETPQASAKLNYLDQSRRYNLPLSDRMAEEPSTLALFLEDAAAQGINFTTIRERGQLDTLYRDYIKRNNSLITKEALDEITIPLRGQSTTLGDEGRSFILAQDLRKQEPNVQNFDDLRRIADASEAEIFSRLERHAQAIDEELASLGGVNLVGNVVRNTDIDDAVVATFKEFVPKIVAGSERATAGNTTFIGSAVNTVLPQDTNFINQANSAYGAARQIQSAVRGAYEKQAKNYIETRLVNDLHAMRQKANFADLQSFNVSARSFNVGFELAEDAGRARFAQGVDFIDSPTNRKILKSFGIEDADVVFKGQNRAKLPDITHLLKGAYQPVGVTPLAAKVLDGLADAEHIAILNRNAVRGATQREMLPPDRLRLPNAARDYDTTVVIYDPMTNEVLDLATAKTIDDAWTSGKARADKVNAQREGSLAAVAMASDFKQRTGKSWTSGMAGSKVRNSALVPQSPESLLDTMLQSIVKDWGTVSKEALNARFRRETRFLDQMSKTLPDADKKIRQGFTRNPYTDTLNVLLGVNTSRPAGNALYKAFNAVDNVGNAALRGTIQSINSSITQGRKADKLASAFNDIGKTTGYKPATEFIEKAGLDQKRLEDVARGWNGFTGFWVLRFAEIGQFLLNAVSIPTILPTTLKTMARRPDETFDTFRERVGWYADVVGDTGEAAVNMNPYKMMTTAIHDMFTDEGRATMAEARKFGNLDATIIENHDLIFDGGRKLSQPGNFQKFKNLATKPTDFSEQYTRTLSYMAGYRLYKQASPDMNTSSLHKLANAFADYNVGDYSKLVRPDNYQGAMGSMMGLFQTFFTNYWQRFGRALEIKDTGTLKTLASSQSVLFGVDSLPGYDVFNSAWSNYDGTDTPWHRLTSAFGVDYAETLMTGTLSNFPRMWGGDGIALYTRGDTNARSLPSAGQIGATPSVMVMQRMMQGIGSAVNVTKQEGIAPRRLLEQAANVSPSRPIRGAIEIINGYTTDKRGNLLNENTRTAEGIMARLIGSKPTDEARQAESLYRQRNNDRIRRARAANMRQWALSEIRRRNGKIDSAFMEDLFTRYLREHKNPATFKTWVRTLHRNAEWSSADRAIYERYKALQSGKTKGPARDLKEREMWELIQPDPDVVDTLGPR